MQRERRNYSLSVEFNLSLIKTLIFFIYVKNAPPQQLLPIIVDACIRFFQAVLKILNKPSGYKQPFAIKYHSLDECLDLS